MSGETRTEWAVDYGDGCGPHIATDQWTARNWVIHWNTYRDDEQPARLMSRTVTTTAWGAAAVDVAARIAALVERHDLPRTMALNLSASADDALLSDLEAMTDGQAAEVRRLWLSREQTATSLTAARTATEPICGPNSLAATNDAPGTDNETPAGGTESA